MFKLVSSSVLALALTLAACSTSDSTEAADLGRLEADLVSFESLERSEAREVYLAMSVTEQANLWRAQFNRALMSGALTAEQAKIITEMRDAAEAGIASKSVAHAFRARLAEVMTPAEIHDFASGLGAHGDGITVTEGLLGNSTYYAPPEGGGGNCTQNLACLTCDCVGWLCFSYTCPTCAVVEDACGPFGWFDCDGVPGIYNGTTCN